MTPDAINAYFTPLDYFLYLGAVFVIMVVYYQWRWTTTCKNNVQVCVVKADGEGQFELAPKSGGSVSLKNPNNNTTRLWPINKLSCIEVPYPGVGFVPTFLQKRIRMVIVDEDDWEPLLNRGASLDRRASADVLAELEEIAETNAGAKVAITQLVNSISVAPVRDLIASPAVLGNLMHEKITEAVIAVNKDVMDRISTLMARMGKSVSPTIFYIAFGVMVIGLVFAIWQIIPLAADVGLIKQSLGITP